MQPPGSPGHLFHAAPFAGPHNPHGVTFIEAKHPARLSATFDDVRPKGSATTDDDDVVLIVLDSAHLDDPVLVRWAITAADVDDVFTGEFEMTTTRFEMKV